MSSAKERTNTSRAGRSAKRKRLLDVTLDALCQFHAIDLMKVYRALTTARSHKMAAARLRIGIDNRRTFIESQKKIVRQLRRAAMEVAEGSDFLKNTPYPMRVLGGRETESTLLLDSAVESIRAVLSKLDPNDGAPDHRSSAWREIKSPAKFERKHGDGALLNFEVDPRLALRSHKAGHQPQPWLGEAKEKLAVLRVQPRHSEALLKAVGLV